MRLGLTLHLSLAELQEIHRKRGEDGVKKCLMAMLELWMMSAKQQPPMWQEVVEALNLIGYTTVAKQLAMKYSE